MRNAFITVLLLLFIGEGAAADVRLFLKPAVTTEQATLYLRDIARIDGSASIKSRIQDILIPESLFRDGYIDRKEIGILIRNQTDEVVLIFGSAVRIYENGRSSETAIFTEDKSSIYSIRSGDRITVVVKKHGISVKAVGTALEDGRLGEFIKVKLKNTGICRGIVSGRREVKVVL